MFSTHFMVLQSYLYAFLWWGRKDHQGTYYKLFYGKGPSGSATSDTLYEDRLTKLETQRTGRETRP